MMINNDAIRCSILVTLLVVFKFVFTNVRAGGLKAKAGGRAPEDKFQNTAPTAEDVAAFERANRIVSNDIENIPTGLIMIWASLLCLLSDPQYGFQGRRSEDDYHNGLVNAHIAFTIIFGVCRYAHSIVYSLAVPTLIRTVFWLFALLSVFALGIIGCITAFRDQHA